LVDGNAGHLVGSGAAAKLIGSTVSWCGYGLVMAASVATTPGPDELLQAALAGDQASFRLLVELHVRELHVHCYRMLGSFHDAEDATQETLLRAWRSLPTFQGRGSLRAWLSRIATTTCLKAIRARRPHGADGSTMPYPEPYPDRLLDDLPADGPGRGRSAAHLGGAGVRGRAAAAHRPSAGGAAAARRA
jgi:DNA-directed RNA polymerase specialized sigma24 family protein